MRASQKTIFLGRILKCFAVFAALACFTTGLHAQISVGAFGTPVDPFTANPPAANWSTRTLVGAASAYGIPSSVGELNNAINGTTNAASTITAQATSDTGAPPLATLATARYSTVGQFLHTRPTGNAATLLMASLRNTAGGTITSFDVIYDLTDAGGNTTTGGSGAAAATLGTPEITQAHRVYYSPSGDAGSWVSLGDRGVNYLTNQAITIAMSGLSWLPGTTNYLLFVDVNNQTNNDAINQLDNFAIANVVGGVATCPGITNQPANVALPQCPAGSATFSISVTGSVQGIQWYRQNGGGGFNPIPGATGSSYTFAATTADSGAQFYATATNINCGATSTTATLTVTPDTVAPQVVYTVASTNLYNITIIFNEPVNTNNTDLYTAFSLTDTNTGNPATIAGQVFSNKTTMVLILDPETPLDLTHGYALSLDAILDDCANNPLVPVTVPVGHPLVVIGFDVNNVWKYDINNGSRLGTGWETGGFDDSAWPSGPAGLGHESDNSATNELSIGVPGLNAVPIRTHLLYRTNGVPAYFRRHFDLPTSTNGVSLTLRHVFEDGAVVYLNGQEAGRYQVPAGVITTNTLSSGSLGDPTAISGSLPLSTAGLVAGDNVIAVLVLQSSATSSDMEMALELTAITPAPATPRPRLSTSFSGGVVTINWTGAGTLQRSTNISSSANWVNLPGATSGFQTNTSSRPFQFFRVTVP